MGTKIERNNTDEINYGLYVILLLILVYIFNSLFVSSVLLAGFSCPESRLLIYRKLKDEILWHTDFCMMKTRKQGGNSGYY